MKCINLFRKGTIGLRASMGSLRAAPKKGAVQMEANFIINIYKDGKDPVEWRESI
jgi:hypothetical protein